MRISVERNRMRAISRKRRRKLTRTSWYSGTGMPARLAALVRGQGGESAGAELSVKELRPPANPAGEPSTSRFNPQGSRRSSDQLENPGRGLLAAHRKGA